MADDASMAEGPRDAERGPQLPNSIPGLGPQPVSGGRQGLGQAMAPCYSAGLPGHGYEEQASGGLSSPCHQGIWNPFSLEAHFKEEVSKMAPGQQ